MKYLLPLGWEAVEVLTTLKEATMAIEGATGETGRAGREATTFLALRQKARCCRRKGVGRHR